MIIVMKTGSCRRKKCWIISCGSEFESVLSRAFFFRVPINSLKTLASNFFWCGDVNFRLKYGKYKKTLSTIECGSVAKKYKMKVEKNNICFKWEL